MNNTREQVSVPITFVRKNPDPRQGLTTAEADARMAGGAHNAAPAGVTPTVGKIILKNVCTLFNLINFLLALAILLVGHPSNTLFFGVALVNTFMGIFQELRAKQTLDKLSILARGNVSVVRDGTLVSLPQEAIVLDDILLLSASNQVVADAKVVQSAGLEVDESLLTGEADSIAKANGDTVLSGSFVVAGKAYVQVTAVGQSSYAGTLAIKAKQEKRSNTPLMRTLNTIIRVLAVSIIPVGALLFYTQYTGSGNLDASVLGASTAIIGMIPEGLILLTGVTLTVGALKLARRKALVQSLPSIETLARVDVLCLDKTGTITDGTLSLESVLPLSDISRLEMEDSLREMMGALQDDNATAVAICNALGTAKQWDMMDIVPFSSARKWSAASFVGRGSFVLGAPAFVCPQGDETFKNTVNQHAAQGYRVLCLAHADAPLEDKTLPTGLACLGLVVLSDSIRDNAAETFSYFEQEGVTLKVISGDDALTVSTIAAKAGILGAENYLDMSQVDANADFAELAQKYTVFGRVSPGQKRALVAGLKKDAHTVCMTGDGVNDVLAMKESDCGVAMIGGSEAARGAADFVLMTNDFSAMIDVLKEGRRVINNIENVACMYLVKTIYSTLLSLLYVFFPFPYPFGTPLKMMPINVFTVGIPSFFLALRENDQRPKGKLLSNILQNSVPAALVVVCGVLIIQLAGYWFELPAAQTATMNVLLTGAVGFTLLYYTAKPLKKPETALLCALAVLFVLSFVLPFTSNFFSFSGLFGKNIFFYLPLLYAAPKAYICLSRLAHTIRRQRFFKEKTSPNIETANKEN